MLKPLNGGVLVLILALPAWGDVAVYECKIDRVTRTGSDTEVYDEAKRANLTLRHRFALDLDSGGGCIVGSHGCMYGVGRLSVTESVNQDDFSIIASGPRTITGGEVKLTFHPFLGHVKIVWVDAVGPASAKPTQTEYVSRPFDCVLMDMKVPLRPR